MLPDTLPDTCETCRFFQVITKESITKERVTKTFCRRRLHSGSMGSKFIGGKVNLATGRMTQTGERREMVASYFPETKPDWWCGEYESALVQKHQN